MTSINWSSITDLGQLPAAANTSSGGTFWVGMLYMIWIVLMIMLSFYGFEVAITVSAFLGLILGLLLVYTGLIAFKWVLTFVGILLFMFLYIIYSGLKARQ